jgi:hypothetical protein
MMFFFFFGSKVKQIKINVPRGGYWPMIGLHSVGECVKLLEKDAWTPEPEDVRSFLSFPLQLCSNSISIISLPRFM